MSGQRIIHQSTFDEAVDENIREFGMSRAEAVSDAIQQFESSGVDLSNIIKDASDPAMHPVLKSLQLIKDWSTGATIDADADAESTDGAAAGSVPVGRAAAAGEHAGVAKAFATLIAELGKGLQNKQIARSNGGVTYVSDAIKRAVVIGGCEPLPAPAGDGDGAGAAVAALLAPAVGPALVLKFGLDALRTLCAGYDDARSEVQPDMVKVGLQCLRNGDVSFELQRSALLCMAVLAVRKEKVKTALYEGGLHTFVNRILTKHMDNPILVSAACIGLARLLTDDDMSVMASNAYQFARTIGKEGMPKLLLSALERHNGDANTAAEVYAALRSVIVTDEICREIDALGGIDIVTRNLALHVSSPVVASASSSAAAGSGAGAGAAGGAGSGRGSVSGGMSVIAEDDYSAAADGADADAAGSVVNDDSAGSAIGGGTAMSIVSSSVAQTILPATGAGAGDAAAAAAAAVERGGGAETSEQKRIRMVRCGFQVLRSLANSDPNKIKMGEGATLQVLLQACETMIPSPSVLDQVVAVLANLCLRLPDNSARVHGQGGLALIAKAMRTHPGHAGLQRSCCLALRNIIVKDKTRIAAAFDEGFENLLQQAYMRHPVSRDVSYACLRDMGVDYAETMIGRAQAERAQRAIAANDIRVK